MSDPVHTALDVSSWWEPSLAHRWSTRREPEHDAGTRRGNDRQAIADGDGRSTVHAEPRFQAMPVSIESLAGRAAA